MQLYKEHMQKAQLTELKTAHEQYYREPDRLDFVTPLPNEAICPSEGTVRQYRHALGRFATGIALVTADSNKGPVGMTINSFSSVSLDPALVLWSVAKHSGRYKLFTEARHFAIQVLAENQYQEAMDFTKDAQAFSSDNWLIGEDNVPLSNSALARFECKQEAVYEGGDHTIIVGRVLRFSQRSGNPLVFAAGEFGCFAAHTAK